MTREPVVAGQFYPAGERRLRDSIESFTPEEQQPEPVLGLLSPHAGYTFSGGVAGATFARAVVPDTVVLLTPSHSYARPALALWTGGNWQTPLGATAMHEDLTGALGELPGVTRDDRPHLPEHSGEVVLPFIQYHNPDAALAAVCVTAAAGLDALKRFGAGLAEVLADAGLEDALIVTSSDMSHESGASALERVNSQDPVAIEKMEALDPDGLYTACRRDNITMCGVLPAVAMLAAVAARGGTEGILVSRATSADSPQGGGSYVVGYAGMVFR